MFTGLVEETGECLACSETPTGRCLAIRSPHVTAACQIGDSLAVNGCCLTVARKNNSILEFDLLAETLRRTNLGNLHLGSRVNLERPLVANGRLGGHFVQGHVDTVAAVIAAEKVGSDLLVQIHLPNDLAPYVAKKGSIAVNGVSLTVADTEPQSFSIWLIPHTRTVTNLGDIQPGDLVNLEVDILAKYVENFLKFKNFR